jgi:hypothetical protein
MVVGAAIPIALRRWIGTGQRGETRESASGVGMLPFATRTIARYILVVGPHCPQLQDARRAEPWRDLNVPGFYPWS